MSSLEPADKTQCQADIPNGAHALTIGGTHRYRRCTNKPDVIATEREPGADGLRGSMSLCEDCKQIMLRQMGDVCDFEVIQP